MNPFTDYACLCTAVEPTNNFCLKIAFHLEFSCLLCSPTLNLWGFSDFLIDLKHVALTLTSPVN